MGWWPVQGIFLPLPSNYYYYYEFNPAALFIAKYVVLFRQVKGPMDHSYFDMFPPETEETPDEFSGWDKDFW